MGQGDFLYMGGGGGAGGGVAVVIGGNTSGTTASVSSGTLFLAGGTNITLSQNGNSITIQGLSVTHSMFQPGYGNQTLFRIGQSSLRVWPVTVPNYVSVSVAHHPLSNSLSTSSNSSFAAALSIRVGLYTRSGSTLSLFTSGSTQYQFSNTSDASSASLQGLRLVTIPFSANITPGDYWLGMVSVTATTNADWITMSNVQQSSIASQIGVLATAVNTTQGFGVGNGIYTANTVNLPASMVFADIKANLQAAYPAPVVTFMNITG